MTNPPADETSEFSKGEEHDLPDRPLECTECKKPIAVRYTEVVGRTINETCMCNECPVLRRRLGSSRTNTTYQPLSQEGKGLCCGNCGTTLQSMQMGNLLGCSTCYEVFGDLLIEELLSSKKMSQRQSKTKGNRPFHLGRAPGESVKLNLSLRLIALNDALKETLRIEDYEQAAWLRDQIKQLTEQEDNEREK